MVSVLANAFLARCVAIGQPLIPTRSGNEAYTLLKFPPELPMSNLGSANDG